MKSTIKIITVIIFIIFFQGILSAQSLQVDTTYTNISKPDTSTFYIRIAGGLGISSLGYGGVAYCSFDLGSILFSFRTCDAVEPFPDHPPAKESFDYSLLVGQSYISKIFYASISAGISKVTTINPGLYYPNGSVKAVFYEIKNSSLGVPFQVDLFLTPFNKMGFGLVLFANINNARSFASCVFCIQFGKLR